MAFNPRNRPLDETDWRLLAELQRNARTSFSELGRRVGLTPPAVAERVRRLEDAAVISGYHAHVDYAALGYGIAAFMTVTYPAIEAPRMYRLAEELPEVRECFHVTGAGSVLLKVVARSMPHLEELMLRIQAVGTTETAIILSTRVIKAVFAPPPPGDEGD